MGTPIFAREILKHLSGLDYKIVASVSQPDRPVGRKRIIEETPVHQLSKELGIDCLQPHNIKDGIDQVLAYKPDMIITCAYGQIIPDEILNYPKLGSFNIHASLLPRLRGGAPIHKAIMYEEEKTGITIMEMIKKMDAGDMILKRELVLNNQHTTESLELELIDLAKESISAALPSLVDQSYSKEEQDESQVTYAYNISKEEEYITFDKAYSTVSAHIRSLIDRPIGYGIVDGQKIKLHGVIETDDSYEAVNGYIIGKHDEGLGVVVDNRVLVLIEVQPIGKKVMSALDFLNGAGKALIGKRFQ